MREGSIEILTEAASASWSSSFSSWARGSIVCVYTVRPCPINQETECCVRAGMTLDRVVMQLDKCFDDGMAYGEQTWLIVFRSSHVLQLMVCDRIDSMC